MILVGDNPFHGISHLSQERVKLRGTKVTQAVFASGLVVESLNSGADGFMFSVDETTLSILKNARDHILENNARLAPIVPYAYGYVRQMVQSGGMAGLLKDFLKNVLSSVNFSAGFAASRAVASNDPFSLLKAYLLYEISRVESAIGTRKNVYSFFLHEIVTDMAIALDLKKIMQFYVSLMIDQNIIPGFETRNFPLLVKKFKEWGFRMDEIAIVAPFNSVGFQMSPSQQQCEKALSDMPRSNTIAMSIMAAGYLGLDEALDYVLTLPNLKGVVLGVSSELQAQESFSTIKRRFGDRIAD
ncbi:MAG: hypothetical protein PXY39_14840 [archaeon]|jgi:hypothetical protein|nr:hypothetical protein [archaeon]